SKRAAEPPDPTDAGTGITVELGDTRAFAATALLPSVEVAASARKILRASALFEASGATAFAYPVDGGALLTLNLPLSGGLTQERGLLTLMIRATDVAKRERLEIAPAPPRAAARQIGLRWAAQGRARY